MSVVVRGLPSALSDTLDHHWLCWELNEEIIAQALNLEFQGLCIAPEEARANLIAIAQTKGLTVRGLGVESEKDVETFLRAGVQGATTNWPDRIYASSRSS
jgi:glycerophosphoryl diester phosphodiesterase